MVRKNQRHRLDVCIPTRTACWREVRCFTNNGDGDRQSKTETNTDSEDADTDGLLLLLFVAIAPVYCKPSALAFVIGPSFSVSARVAPRHPHLRSMSVPVPVYV